MTKWKALQLVSFLIIAGAVVWGVIAWSNYSAVDGGAEALQLGKAVLLGIAGFMVWVVGHFGAWFNRKE